MRKSIALLLSILFFFGTTSYAQNRAKVIKGIIKGAAGAVAGYEIGKKANESKKESETTVVTVTCPSCQGNRGSYVYNGFGYVWSNCQTCMGNGTVQRIVNSSSKSKNGSSISFTGYGGCTYYNSLTKERCSCTGYKGRYEKGPCLNCGHKYVDHRR